jgi:hypothetical protein
MNDPDAPSALSSSGISTPATLSPFNVQRISSIPRLPIRVGPLDTTYGTGSVRRAFDRNLTLTPPPLTACSA